MTYATILLLQTFIVQQEAIDMSTFMLRGSWINVSSPAGIDTAFQWAQRNNDITITEQTGNTNTYLKVDMNVFAGSISLSSTEGLSFVHGNGVRDREMEFYGKLSDVNRALRSLRHHAAGDGVGLLDINILYQNVNQPPKIHVPPSYHLLHTNTEG